MPVPHKDRRRFLSLCVFSMPTAAVVADSMTDTHSIITDPMQFNWQHCDGDLHGQLTGPARGWIAIGFNTQTQLKGTRFLIANVQKAAVEAEIHLAQVPHHAQLATLEESSDPGIVWSKADRKRSQLHFRVSHHDNGFGIDLHPGSRVYLMLAYSTSTDFNHHSAWRQHQAVTL